MTDHCSAEVGFHILVTTQPESLRVSFNICQTTRNVVALLAVARTFDDG
jgi:hypothetical protein